MLTVATETMQRVGLVSTPFLTQRCKETLAIMMRLHGKHGKGKLAYVSPRSYPKVAELHWRVNRMGYVIHSYRDGGTTRTLGLQRLILDAPKGMLVDHINRYPLDNRDFNLRLCDGAQNTWNRSHRKSRRGHYKGVMWIEGTKKYRVGIGYQGEHIVVGEYTDPIYAAKLYDACARYHFGEFAATNFEGDEKLNAFEVREEYLARQKSKLYSPYVGVSKDRSGRYVVSVRVGAQTLTVTSFTSDFEAAKVHDAMVRFYGVGITEPNFAGDEAMSVDQARAHCRYLAFNEGRRSSPYMHVGYNSRNLATPWQVQIKKGYGEELCFNRFFATELQAAQAADEVLEAHGLPRVNFPDT